MASKFAKEEQLYFSENNTDSDSSDGECNNSKTNSRSSSPTGNLENRVFNNCSRSGGPCAPKPKPKCTLCATTCGCTATTYATYDCGCKVYVCPCCETPSKCPQHPQNRLKDRYYC